ncbi:MAG: MgtC/SapB family protein [Betaproteobacteria bacterium]|nr:MAG: MgtC/SapB family protein [Betaproteobacteria bacterium]
MSSELLDIIMRLGAALAAGAMIGLERSYHGRPAGFRTHTLVCLSSALLMLVTVYESHWFVAQGGSRVVVDPTRMAQGIMTGIGFLGAGVIMKEGLAVRGLTTAASIWVTAAIGILLGIGFYIPAMLAVAATLGTLSSFRWIESRMPTEFYAQFRIKFRRADAMPEAELRALVSGLGFSIANLNYVMTNDGERFEYRMVLRTLDPANAQALAVRLGEEPSVLEFRIAPVGA